MSNIGVDKSQQESSNKTEAIYVEFSDEKGLRPHYSSKMAISGRKWQLMRFNNIANYTKVVIPGFCVSCKSENPFVLSIIDYLVAL